MRKRILITGGSGFLGKRLALALKDGPPVFLAAAIKANRTAKDFTGCPAFPVDIARVESIRDVMLETKPEIVFTCRTKICGPRGEAAAGVRGR